MPNKPSAPHVVRGELHKFFLDKDLWYDAFWYTKWEWEARGETVGKGSAFSMTAEGSLCHLLYYMEDGGKLHEEVREICEKHGYWFEFGYHWSLHFYKI